MRRITRAVAVAASALALMATGSVMHHAQAQEASAIANVKKQLATAKTHAEFAAGASTLADLQQHMGHVLNCFEGKNGKNFNAKWGYVCEGQGNGIVTDLQRIPSSASLVPMAQQAGLTALGGTTAKDLRAGKDTAEGLVALLEFIADGVK